MRDGHVSRSDAVWIIKFLGSEVLDRYYTYQIIKGVPGLQCFTFTYHDVYYTGQFQTVYFDDYFSRHTGKNDEASRRLLRFKDGDDVVVNYYSTQIKNILNGEAIICCSPSSSRDHWGGGLVKLIEKLSKQAQCIAKPQLIRRIVDTEKRSRGGDRSIETNLGSMAISDPESCRDKAIVVFDDIFTTGNTLKACAALLWSSSVSSVTCITMGHTVNTW